MINKLPFSLFNLIISLLLLNACTPPDKPHSAGETGSETLSPPLFSQGDEVIFEENQDLLLKNVDIMVVDAFPAEVFVKVSGYLSDICKRITEINESRQGNTFNLNFLVGERQNQSCLNTPQPFEQTVSLAVDGLSAGQYNVKIGNLSESFELVVDNIIRW